MSVATTQVIVPIDKFQGSQGAYGAELMVTHQLFHPALPELEGIRYPSSINFDQSQVIGVWLAWGS